MLPATVEMTEMRFMSAGKRFAHGSCAVEGITTSARSRMSSRSLAVPEGTTSDQIVALFGMPEGAAPAPDDELAQGSSMVHIPANVELAQAFANYAPVAATSILGASITSWIDVDLAPGTYAVTCALPFPGDCRMRWKE